MAFSIIFPLIQNISQLIRHVIKFINLKMCFLVYSLLLVHDNQKLLKHFTACLYALLDGSKVVRAEHLCSALALWTYCEKSAQWIFGDALGDAVADEILRTLRSHPAGLTKNEIGDMFSRHRRKGELGRALALLMQQGMAIVEKEPTGGRPVERWRAAMGSYDRGEAHP